ncbi:putative inorganic phosphate cotransporter isoform X2 [Leptidea sinapis]|uniref:putative inorganic phosphate cotransporter isoform X2 n=1 Tax=Leptidea sinapis TaxID=189913 RepID=UPI0021C2B9E0|nr:putative inorganic phosphate cotransporter isoform X2 [Leptidea sinapis]
MDTEFLRYKFENIYDGVITKTKFKIGIRHIQVCYMFLCSVVMGVMRGSIGIAILCVSDHERSGAISQIHEWSRRIEGTILASFFFGYALLLLPAELFLQQVAEKFVLTAVLLINGAITAAMPTIINKGGWIAACNALFILGMTQACVTPANQQLLSNWLPPNEKRGFNCFVQGGLFIGMMIGMPVSGLLSQSRLGWELIFYSQAMMTFSMAAIWGLLTASSPEQHKAIGDAEQEFIKESKKFYRKRRSQPPWRRVLHSTEFWAVAAVHASLNAIFIFYVVDLPAYLKAYHVPLTDATLHVVSALAMLWLGQALATYAVRGARHIGLFDYFLDIKHFRKFINGLSVFGTVLGLTFLPRFVSLWDNLGVAIIMVVMGILGVQFSGFLENHRDMTQNYSGTLLVMTSAVASVVGAAVPLATGLLVADDIMLFQTDDRRWRVVLSLLSGLCVVSGVVYAVWGSAERQKWDDQEIHKYGFTNGADSLELQETFTTKGKDFDNETYLAIS